MAKQILKRNINKTNWNALRWWPPSNPVNRLRSPAINSLTPTISATVLLWLTKAKFLTEVRVFGRFFYQICANLATMKHKIATFTKFVEILPERHRQKTIKNIVPCCRFCKLGNLHCSFTSKNKMSLEISIDILLTEAKYRWKNPSAFSRRFKIISLEISIDTLLAEAKCQWKLLQLACFLALLFIGIINSKKWVELNS